MHTWRVICLKPEGSPYLVRVHAADSESAKAKATAEGHVVSPRAVPELLPEPSEQSNWVPGELAGIIAVVVALVAIFAPIMSVGAVVLGGVAASDSRGRYGWAGLVIGMGVGLVWQLRSR